MGSGRSDIQLSIMRLQDLLLVWLCVVLVDLCHSAPLIVVVPGSLSLGSLLLAKALVFKGFLLARVLSAPAPAPAESIGYVHSSSGSSMDSYSEPISSSGSNGDSYSEGY